jgi:hypothetical protein
VIGALRGGWIKMKNDSLIGSVKFAHPGITRITAFQYPDGVKVCIADNIETKAAINLSKKEVLRLILELVVSIQGDE